MISLQTWSTPSLSAEEVAKAADNLIVTRDRLLRSLSGLTNAQWTFKPAPESWSIADILEHLVLIEEGIYGMISHIESAPASDPGRNNAEIEHIILSQVPIPLTKVQAPAHLHPSQRWPASEMIELFTRARARTLQLLTESPSLRGHVFPHPVFGQWDGYQWLLAVGAHCERHTKQIEEYKAASA